MARTKRPPRIKGRKLKAGERSLRYLRKHGFTAEIAEKYQSFVEGKGQAAEYKGGYRKDLFGFMDILTYAAPTLKWDNVAEFWPFVFAVQTTSRQQMTAHLRKYRTDPALRQRILDWLAIPGVGFVIHGWECVEVPCKSKDGTKAEWQLTERWVTVEDLTAAQAEGGNDVHPD